MVTDFYLMESEINEIRQNYIFGCALVIIAIILILGLVTGWLLIFLIIVIALGFGLTGFAFIIKGYQISMKGDDILMTLDELEADMREDDDLEDLSD